MTTTAQSDGHEASAPRRGNFFRMGALSSPVARDLVVCVLATVAIFTFVLVVEPFEEIHEISRHVEDLELDDIFLGLALSSFVSAWFSWRRTKDARREVARRTEAEQALQKSNDRLEQEVERRTAQLVDSERRATKAHARLMDAIEAMQDGFVLYDAEDRLVLCNSRYRQAYGDRADRIVPGLKFEDHLRESVRLGLIPSAIGREEDWTRERMSRHRDPTGAFEERLSDGRWVQVAERKTGDGGIVGIRTDVTERRSKAEALRESEEQLRMITDAIPVLITFVDSDEVFRFINRTGEEWYAQPRDQVIGRRVADIIDPSAYQTLSPLIKRVLNGEEIRGEYEVPYFDETIRKILVTYIPHRDGDDQVRGFFSLVEDITAQKETEAQLRQAQKMESIGQLTGGIAHDFNNLLGVVLGNLELIGDHAHGQPDVQRLTDNAINATERGAELTQRLLAYSRKQALDSQVVNIAEIMPNTIELLRRTLEESIRLQTAIPADLWPTLVDPAQLENALLNLSINARDAMPTGGTLTIEAANTTVDEDYASKIQDMTPGEYLMVAVTDTGTGMPPEVVERAFDPFFTTKEVGKGSGLGLSMVFGFVKQSGGHVSIYSEEGYGTSIRLYLPRAAEDQSESETPDARKQESPTGQETVLVVEDNEDLRDLAKSILEGLGYSVLEAEDGQAALSTLAISPHIDLLFTDVVLPGGMHGIDLVQEARQSRPDLKALLTTGYTDHSIMNRVDPSQRLEVLQKPYRRPELAQKVRAVLDAPSEEPAKVAAR